LESNDARGGDTATVTEDDEFAPESDGDPERLYHHIFFNHL